MKIEPCIKIEPSATLTVKGLVLEKRRAGERVFNLSAGEPIINTDRKIIEASHQAMLEGKTYYSPVAGIPELREAVAKWMNDNYNTDFLSTDCVVTCGGKYGVNALVHSLVSLGEEVIIIAPYWVSYTSIVKLYGGTPVILETEEENGWKITPEKIDEVCNEKSKVLILNNASNPTGVLYSKDELEAILRLAKERDLIIISDEVYSSLVYDGKSYTSSGSFSEFKDNVIVVQSCSKIFAMTGWRIGFVFGSKEVVNIVKNLQGQSTSGTPTMGQWAAVEAFNEAERIIPAIRDEMEKRRNIFVETFNTLFFQKITPPSSSLYSFIPISAFGVKEINSVVFCKKVLEEICVAMVPGIAFGKEGYVRCSFGGREEDLVQALEVLAKYFKK